MLSFVFSQLRLTLYLEMIRRAEILVEKTVRYSDCPKIYFRLPETTAVLKLDLLNLPVFAADVVDTSFVLSKNIKANSVLPLDFVLSHPHYPEKKPTVAISTIVTQMQIKFVPIVHSLAKTAV